MAAPTLLVRPQSDTARFLGSAAEGALTIVDDPAEADALLWATAQPDGLADVLSAGPGIRWVQLPMTGVERFLPVIRDHESTVWTCAKDAYGPVVAEMTVGLLITAFRQVHRYLAARTWHPPLPGRLLAGARVTVLGAGAIGQALAGLLRPFGSDVTLVSRRGAPVDGARVVAPTGMREAVAAADAVVVAVPLTEETTGMVDRRFLEGMRPTAWLCNVARGRVVVTEDLVDALRRGTVAGAILDVTDPEPLPDDHPLWRVENVVITPHVANTPALGAPALLAMVADNARRFASGQPLRGVVDPVAAY